MSYDRVMTLRLTAEQDDKLRLIASVDDVSASDVVRAAVEEHILRTLGDKAFARRLQAKVNQYRAAVEIISQARSAGKRK